MSTPEPIPHASASVTVSISRWVDPNRIGEATEWVQAGMDLAHQYPGFLGSGWVRASEDSGHWQMLYRFSTAQRLAAWENSIDRSEWLHAGRDLVLDAREEKRTGIEGWFDAPHEAEPGIAILPPPRWKQAVSIWLGFFPLNLAFTLLTTTFVPGWNDLWIVTKVLLTTFVLTPLMAYIVLPWITRMLRPWLQKQPRA
ncbi:antibiotic biosynthesis monooxygenase [Cryobacterium sp. MLB-32]|uniref:antibiotic biosynthesis monooxygenase n=1 Tax=Cryobacterium sp. MLB-32 TaxID=1529318 RepID=UPI0006924055|nr:antibiotic biosynthesis monooxygenase [Cryobacterium sp. MLB-32]